MDKIHTKTHFRDNYSRGGRKIVTKGIRDFHVSENLVIEFAAMMIA